MENQSFESSSQPNHIRFIFSYEKFQKIQELAFIETLPKCLFFKIIVV